MPFQNWFRLPGEEQKQLERCLAWFGRVIADLTPHPTPTEHNEGYIGTSNHRKMYPPSDSLSGQCTPLFHSLSKNVPPFPFPRILSVILAFTPLPFPRTPLLFPRTPVHIPSQGGVPPFSFPLRQVYPPPIPPGSVVALRSGFPKCLFQEKFIQFHEIPAWFFEILRVSFESFAGLYECLYLKRKIARLVRIFSFKTDLDMRLADQIFRPKPLDFLKFRARNLNHAFCYIKSYTWSAKSHVWQEIQFQN